MAEDKKKVFEYDIKKEGDERILSVNCLGSPYGSSIEQSEEVMARIIDDILEVGRVDRIIMSEAYENEYGLEDTRMLREIATLIEDIIDNKKLISYANFGKGAGCQKCYPQRAYLVQKLLLGQLRRDPLGAYVAVNNAVAKEKLNIKKWATPRCKECSKHYLDNVLLALKKMMEKTELIQKAKIYPQKLIPGNRELYEELFSPIIRPNFTLTRYMAMPPADGKLVDNYTIGDGIQVRIFRLPGKVEYFYHVIPPEFQLPQQQYFVLGAARKIMAGHKPIASEFSDRTRDYFERVGFDLITEIAGQWKIELSKEERKRLAKILVRYTAGLGILEIFLADEELQDVYMNAPIGEYPVRLLHGKWLECDTNIIPTREDAESLAARFRMESGRPLDEANPVLDTEASVPEGRARVAAITRTLSPEGLAFVFRRHRDKPWTYPLFIDNKYISPLFAGVMSFIVDGGRSMLFAGPRSSGKTSLLSATLMEIMRKYRILTVEDTLELPNEQMRKLGYNMISMKVQSAISPLASELPADMGIRTALRLGDSCLIVGEVRSKEAKALYEAMRVGALSNVVAGTIHGDDPHGVFDRVVNDLGVAPTSFKATDLIVMPTPVRSPDGLHRYRRVVYVTEIRKDWVEDPLKEDGFKDLFQYNADKDILEPTDTLLNGESDVLNRIGGRIKGWSGNWDKIFDNIKLRAKTKVAHVDYARKYNMPEIMEAEFYVQSMDYFHIFSEQVADEFGELVSDEIYKRWEEWLKERIKGRQEPTKKATS